MSTTYLLLGSNLGDRLSYLNQAKKLIATECGNISTESGIYETAAWGITEQPSFYNQVIVLQTDLLPAVLMQNLLDIEQVIGRKRIIKYGPRIIDLDILLIDSVILNTPLLTLPHPNLPERRFALLPLAEVAPLVVHPVLKRNILTLLNECTDSLYVKKLSSIN